MSDSRLLTFDSGLLVPRRPKLGQHFLTDQRYRQRIADALDLRAHDLVVEIGAGRGDMTEVLSERARRVMAIEIDASLVQRLRAKFESKPKIEVLQADILSTDLMELCRRHEVENCFVFGNLPYYITSPIIHRLLTFWTRIRAMALLVQREVALRLTATPGTRAYGYLSVMAQLYSEPRMVLGVPPGAFSPPPKVHSALVDFQMRPPDKTVGAIPATTGLRHESPLQIDVEKFLEFVKHCFRQKRKNLVNNLAGHHSRPRVEREIARLGWPPTLRAEQLAVEQLLDLYRALSPKGSRAPGGSALTGEIDPVP